MNKIIAWILAHKVRTFFIVLAAFIFPLVIVHTVFKLKTSIEWLVAEWEPRDVLGYIAGFEAFLGTVALGAIAFWQNQQIHNQHIESLEPILSMRLILIGHSIYLLIENTGESRAKDIKISVDHIENNGEIGLDLDALFQSTFELYPHEIVQGRVAKSGGDIMTSVFPQIFVHVSYVRADINRMNEYSRSVIFDGGYSRNIIADVNLDNYKMESDIDCIARVAVRVANYLDGRQVSKVDKIDTLGKQSLKSDLVSAISTAKVTPTAKKDGSNRKRVRRNKNTRGEDNA